MSTTPPSPPRSKSRFVDNKDVDASSMHVETLNGTVFAVRLREEHDGKDHGRKPHPGRSTA
jgi:hypothetical protein